MNHSNIYYRVQPVKYSRSPNTLIARRRMNRYTNAIITASNLSKSFSAGGVQVQVVKNIDLEIEEGAFTVVMGPSGSGKSTLLYAISGMDSPSGGRVTFGGCDITDYTSDELAVFRRSHCGFVFQQVNLIESMSAFDNVLACGLLTTNNKKEVAARASALFDSVGLDAGLRRKFPAQLSGGEAQRVGIVRALINNPAVLFADEPTGALNSAAGFAVMNVISKMHGLGQSVVMVTHDMKTAARGSRIIYLRDGAISGELELPPYGAEYAGGAGDEQGAGIDARRLERLQKFLEDLDW